RLRRSPLYGLAITRTARVITPLLAATPACHTGHTFQSPLLPGHPLVSGTRPRTHRIGLVAGTRPPAARLFRGTRHPGNTLLDLPATPWPSGRRPRLGRPCLVFAWHFCLKHPHGSRCSPPLRRTRLPVEFQLFTRRLAS